MFIIFVIFIGGGLVFLMFMNNSMNAKPTSLAEIVDVVDGKTVEIFADGESQRVMLAGIGFPPQDEKALFDSTEFIREMAVGRRLNSVVQKNVNGLKYVTLESSSGESVNQLMLSRGLARYDSHAVGILPNLVNAEFEAKKQAIGIWDSQRNLYKHLNSEQCEDGEAVDSADEGNIESMPEAADTGEQVDYSPSDN